ncbi:hypothetical protein [Streptomyces sp. ISID311]|uniref:hypothetical protein n=1 Tax=Streptomyces sp. ISID311 TaxID=2601673 RepID=UPI0011BD304A|nr:hypothetical protein [Streptomyces sp. ISID311]TXC99473.1 hypothetical protein FS847_04020 [Streptomyces sp. ISID311]
MRSAAPIPPRPRPDRAGVAAGGTPLLAGVAVAFSLAQLLFVTPGLHLGWDETVYVSQVAPHIPSAYFSAPRARGVPVLVAPLALVTTSTLALRIYLAVLSGGGLFLALWVWRRLRPVPVLALAGTLFAGLWVTQLYGPQAMPNLWVAFAGLAAVGCFLRAAQDRADRSALVQLPCALAAVALLRPSDAAWLTLPLAAAALLVPHWRRPVLLAVIAAGLVLGGAPWIIEAYASYGGIVARLHRSSAIEGGIGLHIALGDILRTMDGGTMLCRPCTRAWRHWDASLWWFALPLAAASGVPAAARARRLATALLPVLCGLSVAIPYLFLIDYAAPRFLLPTYALAAVPVADCALSLTASVRPALRPAALTLLATLVTAQTVSQHLTLTHAVHVSTAGNGDYARIAADLRALGVRPPCLITGRLATPVGYEARCASGQTAGHNRNTTRAAILSTARTEPVAVLVMPHHRPPAYARAWTPHPLPGLRRHHGYRVFLSPR